MRIRGLWKLLDGRDWLWGNLLGRSCSDGWDMGHQLSASGTRALAAADLGGVGYEPHHRTTEQKAHKLENSYTKEVFVLL